MRSAVGMPQRATQRIDQSPWANAKKLRRLKTAEGPCPMCGSFEHKAAPDGRTRHHPIWKLALYLAGFTALTAFCQAVPPSNQAVPALDPIGSAVPVQTAHRPEDLPKHIFWIIPNYRSDPDLQNSKPLSSGRKFKLAARDSFDPGTFLLTGIFAGISQNSRSTPSYGQGLAGFGRYYGSTYGDFMAGNVMTEALYPSLFHQDPRYFRRGTGSAWSRLGYAVSQIFTTHGDNRRTQFNISEIGGNATAVALSNTYNPDNRTAADAAVKLGVQLGVDMAGNILKEFAPDLHRKLRRGKNGTSSQGPPH